jgi:hypothetical protein
MQLHEEYSTTKERPRNAAGYIKESLLKWDRKWSVQLPRGGNVVSRVTA